MVKVRTERANKANATTRAVIAEIQRAGHTTLAGHRCRAAGPRRTDPGGPGPLGRTREHPFLPNAWKVVMVEPFRTGRPLGKN